MAGPFVTVQHADQGQKQKTPPAIDGEEENEVKVMGRKARAHVQVLA